MRIIILFTALAIAAHAHFTFVVPDAGNKTARLFLSEKLVPDDAIDAKIAQSAKLQIRNAAGEDTPLELSLANDCLQMKLPGSGPRIVHGMVDLGVSANRGPKPFLLLYYPKTLVGGAASAMVGGNHVVEMIPQGEPGKTTLKLIARGKPVAGAEITVLLPSGSESKVKTNAEGIAGPFEQTGRYGAWARFWEDSRGQREGVAYEQVRHYATLVFDAFATVSAGTPLPEGTSSFGAALPDSRWLYVYGGHISPTHTYSTASVSGKFARLDLQSQRWEELAAGPGLQGMNLVSHKGQIYRVGGMAPLNKPSEKADTRSVSSVARFDPQTKTWTDLVPLPEERSSHDMVAIGDKLIVTGGWNMRGSQPSVWAKTTYTLDLSKGANAAWEAHPQPYQRRAFIAAVHRGKMYVIGGIMPSGAVSTEVDVYDPQKNTWSKGPKLPGPDMNGFAPAAVDHNGTLYASTGDGSLFRLNDESSQWEDAGQSTPRLAHRMVSDGSHLLILGGAVKGKNLDLVEKVSAR